MTQSIASIFRLSANNYCPKGQVLVNPDETPRGVYLIRKGYIKAYDISATGEYQLVGILGPEEYFPLAWAFGRDSQQFFYETMTAVDFSLLPLKLFQEISESDPIFLKSQLFNFAITLRALEQRVQNHQQRSARGKVAFQFLFLGQYFGRSINGMLCIDTPLTYQDLADSLNITRETVNRTVNDLIGEGIIVRLQRKFCIADMTRLNALIGSDTALNN